jgi:hypothetical protein
MKSYVFIESRDPFESRDAQFVVENASALKARDHEVIVFLVQNGVLGARRNAAGSHLSELAKAGISLLADSFSLRERGIGTPELLPAVKESTVDALVEILVRDNTKAIWH